MARVLGIGGAFLKSDTPRELAQWYLDALGLGAEFGPSNTGAFGVPLDPKQLPDTAYVQFSIAPRDSPHFRSEFMLNFVVDDMPGILDRIRTHGGTVLREGFVLDGVGEFAWVADPDGNPIELWQPAA